MNNLDRNINVVLLTTLLMFPQLYAQKKLGQTGFQFLSVVPDARSAALAGAMTTMPTYSSALWTNPASMASMGLKVELMANQNQWISDINHYSLTTAYRPYVGQYGVIGFSLLYVDYGQIEGTIRANNDQGYLEIGNIQPFAYAIGIGYAKKLTDKFSVGGQIKLVNQNLGPAMKSLEAEPYKMEIDENEVAVIAFDFGTIYRTGFKSLLFGMSVRNFSQEVRYARQGFQLPLTFNIGISINALDVISSLAESHAMIFSLDATHPRSYPEFIKIGMEYSFQKTFFLRLGYVSNRDEEDLSYGFGVQKFGFGLDYAYTPFGVFENVQRFSVFFSL